MFSSCVGGAGVVCGANVFLGAGWVDWIDGVCAVSVAGVSVDIGCWVGAVGVGVGGVCIVPVIGVAVDTRRVVGAVAGGGWSWAGLVCGGDIIVGMG